MANVHVQYKLIVKCYIKSKTILTHCGFEALKYCHSLKNDSSEKTVLNAFHFFRHADICDK